MSLTYRQRECFQVLSALTVGDVAPTLDEIGAAMGICSKSNVSRLLTSLEQEGYIRRVKGRARGITIIKAPNLAEHLATLIMVHGGLSVVQALDAAIKAVSLERAA